MNIYSLPSIISDVLGLSIPTLENFYRISFFLKVCYRGLWKQVSIGRNLLFPHLFCPPTLGCACVTQCSLALLPLVLALLLFPLPPPPSLGRVCKALVPDAHRHSFLSRACKAGAWRSLVQCSSAAVLPAHALTHAVSQYNGFSDMARPRPRPCGCSLPADKHRA